jgi:hypothetical protein
MQGDGRACPNGDGADRRLQRGVGRRERAITRRVVREYPDVANHPQSGAITTDRRGSKTPASGTAVETSADVRMTRRSSERGRGPWTRTCGDSRPGIRDTRRHRAAARKTAPPRDRRGPVQATQMVAAARRSWSWLQRPRRSTAATCRKPRARIAWPARPSVPTSQCAAHQLADIALRSASRGGNLTLPCAATTSRRVAEATTPERWIPRFRMTREPA